MTNRKLFILECEILREEMKMKEREKFSSRLGFILISAGCAIGIGNVWRFPYITGQYGGGAFVLIYLLFLVILGLPIMVMEFSVDASRHSAARSFHVLEPKGTKWHLYSYAMLGNYLLMMFYTTVCGWMLDYFVKWQRARSPAWIRMPWEMSLTRCWQIQEK